MDVAIGISLGSSLQIALFVIPFIVLVGWGMGRPVRWVSELLCVIHHPCTDVSKL